MPFSCVEYYERVSRAAKSDDNMEGQMSPLRDGESEFQIGVLPPRPLHNADDSINFIDRSVSPKLMHGNTEGMPFSAQVKNAANGRRHVQGFLWVYNKLL